MAAEPVNDIPFTKDLYPDAPKLSKVGEFGETDVLFIHAKDAEAEAPACYAHYPEGFGASRILAKYGGEFVYCESKEDATCLLCFCLTQIREGLLTRTSPGFSVGKVKWEAERRRTLINHERLLNGGEVPRDSPFWRMSRALELSERDRRYLRWLLWESPY